MGNDGFLSVGSVMVETTQNKGHDPEFWAEQITKKYAKYQPTLLPIFDNKQKLFKTTSIR